VNDLSKTHPQPWYNIAKTIDTEKTKKEPSQGALTLETVLMDVISVEAGTIKLIASAF
jgi:hypothetical protein